MTTRLIEDLPPALKDRYLSLFSASYRTGKSLYIPNKFEKWYEEGNRMPDDLTVMVADFNGLLDGIEKWSDEERNKKMNFIYFMITYCGGFPNAIVVTKDELE